jgi:hypothetical protein
MEAESTGIDGCKIDTIVKGLCVFDNPMHLFCAEDDGEFVFMFAANEVEDGPVTDDEIAVEEFDTCVADSH